MRNYRIYRDIQGYTGYERHLIHQQDNKWGTRPSCHKLDLSTHCIPLCEVCHPKLTATVDPENHQMFMESNLPTLNSWQGGKVAGFYWETRIPGNVWWQGAMRDIMGAHLGVVWKWEVCRMIIEEWWIMMIIYVYSTSLQIGGTYLYHLVPYFKTNPLELV